MPSRAYILEAASTDVDIVTAVNDLLDALGVTQIPDDGPDTIAHRISAMAKYVRRSAAGSPEKRMALSDYNRRGAPQDLEAQRRAIATDIAKRRGISFETALACVP
ncbi:MAG: hypothetical protein SH850_31020 [Planctomycetaceae bacterium]|nr:hypothetical protein [Planctomycetaceae bacterium]